MIPVSEATQIQTFAELVGLKVGDGSSDREGSTEMKRIEGTGGFDFAAKAEDRNLAMV